MKKLIVFCLILSIVYLESAISVGSLPVPSVTDVSFTANVSYDPLTERFTYRYGMASGASNQGDIIYVFLDIKRFGRGLRIPPIDFHYSKPNGTSPSIDEMETFQRLSTIPFGTTIEALDVNLPPGWGSSATADGYLIMSPPVGGSLDVNGVPTSADLISPGESFDNLVVTGLSAPTLREVVIVPDWELIVSDPEALTNEMIDQGNQVLQDIIIRTTTIGPEAVNYTGGLLPRTINDVEKMIALGWITDISLITNIQTLLTEAQTFKSNAAGTQAKIKLQQAIDLMASVTEVQMRREAIDLLLINIQLVINHTPDTFIPPDLALTVNPQDIELEIGNEVVFRVQLIDRARNNEPTLSFDSYSLRVLSGPHAGLFVPGNNDSGRNNDTSGSTMAYTGTKVGVDIVEITRNIIPSRLHERKSYHLPLAALDGSLDTLSDAINVEDDEFRILARVTWTGGADYVISFFSPPFLDYRGASSIWIYEQTKNIGTTDASVSSSTRYYLSTTSGFDISTAYQLQQRTVIPLAVDAESKSGATEVIWPTQFPAGRYYFAACTDADNAITELNENNNCSFHQVDQVSYHVAMLSEDPAPDQNQPPVCDQAVASPDTLWPPNHKLKNISIDGVIDVDQDDILITITSITQDEEVNSVASGSTSPDGKGVGTPFAQVRAERDGTGDGRVYEIHFKATDTAGNECTGKVSTSAVVHDQSRQSFPAIDSGQVYDSTVEFH